MRRQVGSGWVAAEDRGLLLRLGLGPAYTAALAIPGISPFGLLLTQRSFSPSPEAVKFVEEQKQSLVEKGPKGEQVISDLENWAEGINAYEQTLPEKSRLPHVGLTDAILASHSSARSSETAAAGNCPTRTFSPPWRTSSERLKA